MAVASASVFTVQAVATNRQLADTGFLILTLVGSTRHGLGNWVIYASSWLARSDKLVVESEARYRLRLPSCTAGLLTDAGFGRGRGYGFVYAFGLNKNKGRPVNEADQ